MRNNQPISSNASTVPVIVGYTATRQLNPNSPKFLFEEALRSGNHRAALDLLPHFSNLELEKKHTAVANILSMCTSESPCGFGMNPDSFDTIQIILNQYPQWIHPFDVLSLLKKYSNLESRNPCLIVISIFEKCFKHLLAKIFERTALNTDRFQLLQKILYNLLENMNSSPLNSDEEKLLNIIISNSKILDFILLSSPLSERERLLISNSFSKAIELREDRTDLHHSQLALALVESNPNIFQVFSLEQFQIAFAHILAIDTIYTSETIADLTEFILKIPYIVLNPNQILELYTRNMDMDIMFAIETYVTENPEQNIVLPIRNDLLGTEEEQVEYEVAYDVHNYANGLSIPCLQYMQSALEHAHLPLRPFTIENLVHTIDSVLTDREQKEQVYAVLRKINPHNSENYFDKLQSALPLINTFIIKIAKDQNIPIHTFWELFIRQSFIEAATAYEDEISCVKGIYERLFSGLRIMDPGIDILFVCSESIKHHFPTDPKTRDPKIDILQSQEMLCYLIENIVKENIEKVTDVEEDFLKNKVIQYLMERFERDVFLQIEEKMKLLPTDLDFDMKKIVSEIWNSRKKIAERKFTSFQESLRSIDLSKGIDPEHLGFIEVVNQILSNLKSGLFGEMSFKDISIEDISDATCDMIQKIRDVANPERIREQQSQHGINELIATESIMRDELIRVEDFNRQEISIV